MKVRKRYEIEELLKKIQDCIDLYKKNYVERKNYTIFLANGEMIRYSITPNNVAHLLGVDLDYLRQTKKYKNLDNFELLQDLCESNYQQINMLAGNIIDTNKLFSPFIDKKIEAFESILNTNLKQSINEIEFVCCYKSKNSWDVTTKNQKYDYIIVKRLPNDKISLLCIVINGGKCYAMSNQLYDSFEHAKEAFRENLTHQEISFVNAFHVYNTYTDGHFKTSITTNQKTEKLNTMRYYKKLFDCNIDISSDYEYLIGLLKDNKSEKNENKDTIDEIVEAINNGKLIDRFDFEDSLLLDVIDCWNDHITNNSTSNDDKNNISYTEAIKNLKEMKEIIASLEKKIEILKVEKSELEEKNSEITSENNSLKGELQEITEIINSIYETIKPRIK